MQRMNIPEQLRGCSQAPSPAPQIPEQEHQAMRPSSVELTNGKRAPEFSHLWSCDEPVTSVAQSGEFIYAGTISGKVHVYDLHTYQHVSVFEAHSASILVMFVYDCGGETHLFTGSSDSLIKMWLPAEHNAKRVGEPLLNYTIYCLSDVGDIFSMGLLNGVLYFGTQNASIHWVRLEAKENTPGDGAEEGKSSYNDRAQRHGMHPAVRPSRFFDSAGPGGRLAPQQRETKKLLVEGSLRGDSSLLEVPPDNQIAFAHDSAVYAMTVDPERRLVITGSGDGVLKIWKGDKYGDLVLRSTFETTEAILDMVIVSSWQLCCGLDTNAVLVLDLEMQQLSRHELPSELEDAGPSLAIAADEDGIFVSRGSKLVAFDSSRTSVQEWDAPGLVTAAVSIHRDNSNATLPLGNLITTSHDGSIVLWNAPLNSSRRQSLAKNAIDVEEKPTSNDECDALSRLDLSQPWHKQAWEPNSNESMMAFLAQLVRHQTVSSRDGKYWNDCRKCATAIKETLGFLGAQTELFAVDQGNPIVYAQFSATKDTDNKCRILYYGHYDVIEVEGGSSPWKTPPFQLTNVDGYMHGRGVTDNKGPVSAAIFAVAGLYARGELTNDVVFLIEGEEECGSFGFRTAIEQHIEMIGNIDWIIFSNSYWLNDTIPCLNYGLRGVVLAEIEIASGKADVHSGVDGGLFREPAHDMINLLARLTEAETGHITIPGFNDSVLPITIEEQKFYEDIVAKVPSMSISDLMHKWRFPSVTIHKFQVSGPGNQTVIPASVKAYISLRIVPNQTAPEIKEIVESHLRTQFGKFNSTNNLNVTFKYDADPWLGDPSNEAFRILADAQQEAWGVPPLYIREGGSVPVARALEKIFEAPAVQLPCGQSSDGAHLDNERLRITNFLNARKVFERIFVELKVKKNN